MRRIALTSPPLAAVLAVTGCGSGHEHRTAAAPSRGAACGRVTTAGDATAELKVTRGSTSCAEAASVFRAFFARIAAGRAPGQGTGGEVNVQGWSCVIYPPGRTPPDGRGADCAKGGTTVTAFQAGG